MMTTCMRKDPSTFAWTTSSPHNLPFPRRELCQPGLSDPSHDPADAGGKGCQARGAAWHPRGADARWRGQDACASGGTTSAAACDQETHPLRLQRGIAAGALLVALVCGVVLVVCAQAEPAPRGHPPVIPQDPGRGAQLATEGPADQGAWSLVGFPAWLMEGSGVSIADGDDPRAACSLGKACSTR